MYKRTLADKRRNGEAQKKAQSRFPKTEDIARPHTAPCVSERSPPSESGSTTRRTSCCGSRSRTARGSDQIWFFPFGYLSVEVAIQYISSKAHTPGDSSFDSGDSEDDALAVAKDNEQQPPSKNFPRKIDRARELSPRQFARLPLEPSQINHDMPLTPHSPLFLPPLDPKADEEDTQPSPSVDGQHSSATATFSMMTGRTINRIQTAPRRAFHSLGRSLNTEIVRLPSRCAAGLFKRSRNSQRPQRSPHSPQRRCGPM